MTAFTVQSYLTINDILSAQFAEIQDVAASVGIDWTQHCNESFPFKSPAKALDKASKGKVFIHADIRVCKRTGYEFPYLTFVNQRASVGNVTFNGYDALQALLKGQAPDTQETKAKREKQRVQREKQQAETKAAQEAQDASETADARKLTLAHLDTCSVATSCFYFERKNLAEYIPLFFSGAYFHPAADRKYDTQGTIVPYFDVKTHEPCGFEHITNKVKLKTAKIGSSYAVFSGNDPQFDKIAIVGEGIATVLSVHKSLEGRFPAFAAGGSKHVQKVVRMLLNEGFEHVYVLADNDPHGGSLKDCTFDTGGKHSVHMPETLGHDFSDVFLDGGADAVCELLTKEASAVTVTEDITGTEDEGETATVITEHRRYSSLMPKVGAVSVLKSEKGTGKTTVTREFIRQSAGKTIVIVCRQLLAQQMTAELLDVGAVSYLDKLADHKNAKVLVVSPEYIANHLHADDLASYETCFIDEIESVFEHITHSTTMRDSSLLALQKILAIACSSTNIVVADADADAASQQLAAIVREENDKKSFTLTNTYKPRAERQDAFVIHKSKETLEAEFLASARREKTIFISDTKRACEDMQAALIKSDTLEIAMNKRRDVLLMTADTTDDHMKRIDAIELTQKDVDNGLSKLDIYVRQHNVVLYSPCWGAGVSIAAGHGFSKAYVNFKGTTLTAEACSQMLARFRDVGSYVGHIGQYKNASAAAMTDAEKIKSCMIINPAKYTAKKQGINLNIGRDGKVKIDDFAEFWAITESKVNRSKADFYNRMLHVLTKEGFEIGYFTSEVKLEEKDAQAIAELAEAKKEEKAQKNQELATELSNTLGVDFVQALRIVSKRNKLNYNAAIKARSYAIMSRDQAYEADKKEVSEVGSGKRSLAQLTHTKAKRKLTTAIYKLIGVDPLTHEAQAVRFDMVDRNTVKKIKRFSKSMMMVHGKALAKTPEKALVQLAKVIGIEIQKAYNAEIYSVNTDSLKDLLTWQEFTESKDSIATIESREAMQEKRTKTQEADF